MCGAPTFMPRFLVPASESKTVATASNFRVGTPHLSPNLHDDHAARTDRSPSR